MRKVLFVPTVLAGLFGLLACTSPKTPSLSPSESGPPGSSSSQGVVSSTLIVSEVVARSANNAYLGGGDWIELYNGSSDVVNLSDYTLSDDAGAKATLPDESLNAGEYFVIAAVDAEAINPPLPNVPFKLGSDDSVFLYKGSELVHSLTWLGEDVEKGSSFGISEGVAQTLRPTPKLANQVLVIESPTGNSDLVISEIVSKSNDEAYLEGGDWIELYNSGSEVVDLAGYSLADSVSDPILFLSSVLGAGEYVVIAAVDSENLSPPSPSVPFKLGAKDSVLLYKGGELVDRLSWVSGDADKGYGYGLVGGDAKTTIPTPALDNVALTPLVIGVPTGNTDLLINEVVAKSNDESYLGGSDWLELYNSGGVAIDLSAYFLEDSGSERIALSGSLGAGEYKVIAAVGSSGDSISPYVPFKLGKSDSLQLYLGSELVRHLSWENGEAEEGDSYGLFNGVAQTTSPTPGAANSL